MLFFLFRKCLYLKQVQETFFCVCVSQGMSEDLSETLCLLSVQQCSTITYALFRQKGLTFWPSLLLIRKVLPFAPTVENFCSLAYCTLSYQTNSSSLTGETVCLLTKDLHPCPL